MLATRKAIVLLCRPKVAATGHNDPVAAAKDRLAVTPIGMEPECGALIGPR
jgi:hypothetical protein